MSLLAQKANFGDAIGPVSSAYGTDPSTYAGTTGNELVLGQFEGIISTSISVLTVVGGLFFVVYFFLAALKWITAGGDGGKVGKARDEMVQGVIGLIVIVAAYGIIGLLGTVLGLDLLNPAKTVLDIITP